MISYLGLGARLRKERDRLKLTQTQLGALGGVSLQAQHTYETDKRSPNARYLAGIASGGVDILYVVTGERKPIDKATLTMEESRLVTNYNAAPNKDKRVASQLLESLARKKSA